MYRASEWVPSNNDPSQPHNAAALELMQLSEPERPMAIQFPRALIMAHYDPHGLVDPHVRFALKAYRQVFSHVTLVSTGVRRLPSDCEALVDTFIARDNVGFDFFSWKVGFNALSGKSRFFEIVFANDSVYGPLFDIEHCLLAPPLKDADLWGMTASMQYNWHIQSFFFAMRNRLAMSTDAQAFWDGIAPFLTKLDAIHAYELSMSEFFSARGWTTKVLFDPLRTPNGGRTPVAWMFDPAHPRRSVRYMREYSSSPDSNPMHHRWYDVLQSGVPFTKVELLRSNPKRLPLGPIRRYLRRRTRYPTPLITDHIKRTGAV